MSLSSSSSKIPPQKVNEPIETIIIYDPNNFEEYYDQIIFLCFICKSKPCVYICDDCNNNVCNNCAEEKTCSYVECNNCRKEKAKKRRYTILEKTKSKTKLVKT